MEVGKSEWLDGGFVVFIFDREKGLILQNFKMTFRPSILPAAHIESIIVTTLLLKSNVRKQKSTFNNSSMFDRKKFKL